MKTRLILSLLFVSLIVACDKNKDCGLCMTPPSPFYFEIVDKDTRENIFTSEQADPADISLTNTSDESSQEYDFISENQVNIIMINSIGWKTETIEATLKIGETEVFTLLVEAERKSDECCNWTEYHNVEISNADFSYNSSLGIYTIYY